VVSSASMDRILIILFVIDLGRAANGREVPTTRDGLVKVLQGFLVHQKIKTRERYATVVLPIPLLREIVTVGSMSGPDFHRSDENIPVLQSRFNNDGTLLAFMHSLYVVNVIARLQNKLRIESDCFERTKERERGANANAFKHSFLQY
jgi:hypothetical protein